MNQFTGLLLGLTVIAGIWTGHILVRRIEFSTVHLKIPIVAFFSTGILLAILSLFSKSNLLSGVLGILGIIFFWNGIETHHQENRVKKGHAPANPQNPRHRQILVDYPSATIENILKHDHSLHGEAKQ